MKFLHIQTPLWKSAPIQKRTGKTVYLKMECFQPTGSFKPRGIGYLCQKLVASGKKHLVSCSAGNAGYTSAFAGRILGVKVTVFIPTSSSPIFIERIKSQGAEVIIQGKDLDEATHAGKEYLKTAEDAAFIHPYDDPDIWLGHSTIMDEVHNQIDEKPEAIVVAVGGGGLACGILDWMYRWGWHDVPVYGVETEGAASFTAAVNANHLVTLPKIDTIATSLGAKTITYKLLEWTKKLPVFPITVTDAEAVQAVRTFLDDHYVLVEPACGAPLSLVYNEIPELADKKSILVIICGGIGISWNLLNQYLAQVSR